MAAAVLIWLSAAMVVGAQTFRTLEANKPETFKIKAKRDVEYVINLKPGDLCNITANVPQDVPMVFALNDAAGEPLIKEGDVASGLVFVAEKAGRYRLMFKWIGDVSETDAAQHNGKEVTVQYSDKLSIAKGAVSKGVRRVNGYEAKILDEPGDEGNSYFVVEKNGAVKAVSRVQKVIAGGYTFSDDAGDEIYRNKSAALFRSTPDKTGDGTPDVAIDYFSGGAHCCFSTTFFELGKTVRELPTIDTANSTLVAIAKRPEGGLRFEFAEQAWYYWTINFASSPSYAVIYDFKDDQLVPRFDLMKKPAPTLAALKRKAVADKAKMNLKAYKDPETNFNDFDEAFWGEMIHLIYTGHEDLAWTYYDLVWPAKKPGKTKFLADFKDQLSKSAYGDWKKMGN